MYSYEDRIRAVRLYIKLNKRFTATILQFGYPTKNALKTSYREYEQRQEVSIGYVRSRLKYSDEQKKVAVEHYLDHDHCIAGTIMVPVLSWYVKELEQRLRDKPAQLMLIGYSFRDHHINNVIADAVNAGLKIFVKSPDGAKVARQANPTRDRDAKKIAVPTRIEQTLDRSLIGASRRLLSESFSNDVAEHGELMRFFER